MNPCMRDSIDDELEIVLELIFKKDSMPKSDWYDTLYRAVTITFRDVLVQFKPLLAFDIILELIFYFTEIGADDKCKVLNKLGLEIYNT